MALVASQTFSTLPPKGLPASIRLGFFSTAVVSEAEAITRQVTRGHYENFSVVSFLLPRDLRQDFCNIYAFCRIADDLGDELGDADESTRRLAEFNLQTRACFAGQSNTAVFTALSESIRRHGLPIDPFIDLIDAFEQDQRITRYDTQEQLLDYCRRSANPVGRLVLYLCGYGDEARQTLSDHTCTALQLVNFYQDVRRDIVQHDRIYIPAEHLRRFGVTQEQLREGRCTSGYRELIQFEVSRVRDMFQQGRALLPMLDKPYRRQIALFGLGGMAICDAIEKQDYDTLTRRPTLSRTVKLKLALSALLGGPA